ncbi:hypothetical protein SAMN05216269_12236 [Flavobacterium xinjiangense]|uniref:Uncharacterized protein n=1 Tax=Flavobacterium xinjiangense TaxID=178356 RepID=A0A1M7PTG3_9FLAO|nr:hypothetical protein SAMN05216269_12236 [Flavobacterium xinjiangense]
MDLLTCEVTVFKNFVKKNSLFSIDFTRGTMGTTTMQ